MTTPAVLDNTSRTGDILHVTRVFFKEDDLSAWEIIDELPTNVQGYITDESLDFKISLGTFGTDLTVFKGYCEASYLEGGSYFC